MSASSSAQMGAPRKDAVPVDGMSIRPRPRVTVESPKTSRWFYIQMNLMSPYRYRGSN